MEYIDITLIRPAENPVRRARDEGKINELAQSIKEKGVLQPIKVRPVHDDGTTCYEIVYGARRWEASQIAGLPSIPSLVQEMTDSEALIEGVIENLQREDMTDIEISASLNSLADDLGKPLTIQRVSELIGLGKRRTTTLMALTRKNADIADAFVKKGAIDPLKDQPPKDLATKAEFINWHIKPTDSSGNDQTELRQSVAEKVANEGLSQQKTAQLAEAVSVAPTPEAKKKLLEFEFNSTLHNPEIIKHRAERLGPHDDLYQDKRKKSPQEMWELSKEIKEIVPNLVKSIKTMGGVLSDINKASKADGKMSPEVKQFMASKLRTFIDQLNALLSQLEGE